MNPNNNIIVPEITFEWQIPLKHTPFIADPYASFTARQIVTISDADELLLSIDEILNCAECLQWQINEVCRRKNLDDTTATTYEPTLGWRNVNDTNYIDQNIQFINTPFGANGDMISSEMKIMNA